MTASFSHSYFDSDHSKRCIHCVWVEVLPLGALGCVNPKCCYGQAKSNGACCRWEREPGSDDEVGEEAENVGGGLSPLSA